MLCLYLNHRENKLGRTPMKEYLPTIIIVCIALAWSEFRYRQLSFRMEQIEQKFNADINKKSSSKAISYKEESSSQKYSSAHPQKSYKKKEFDTNVEAKRLKKQINKSDNSSPNALDLTNPEVQEELHQFLEEREKEQKEIQRAEGLGKYLDYVDKKIESYSQSNQLPSSVSQAIMIEIQTRTNEYVAVEHAAEDGEIDWSEAKPEMARIKEEGKANLIDILGEEEYQEFERFVWGRE